MKIYSALTTLLLLLIAVGSKAQSSDITKSILQQNYFSEHFLRNRTSALEIKSTKTIDSLFSEFQSSWERVAPDTLKKYKLKISLSTFKYIDAYCYFVSLVNVSGMAQMNGEYWEHLLRAYMIPSVRRDIATYKQNRNTASLELIWHGSLGNTIAIGLGSSMSRAAVLDTYNLYSSFEKLGKPLRNSSNKLTRNYVDFLFKDIENYKLVLEAKIAYFDKNYNSALNYLLKGLDSNTYPSKQVLAMSEQLLNTFTETGDKEKSLKLLNALMMNTTQESISRALLKDWYVKTDPKNGQSIFTHILESLPSSSFKNSTKTFKLPTQLNFIANAVSPEVMPKTKYYLIDVWYTACSACLEEIPDLNSLYERLKGRSDITFISINTDFVNGKRDEQYVLERSLELGIKFPIVYDKLSSNLFTKLGITSFPGKCIIDSTGRIITKLDNSANSLASFDMFIKELE